MESKRRLRRKTGTGSSAVANPSEGGGSLVGNVDDKSDSGHDAATVPAPGVGDPVIGKCDEDVSDTRAPSFSGKSPQDVSGNLDVSGNRLQDVSDTLAPLFSDQVRTDFKYYEDVLMVHPQTGEVTMKMYYMHPGRVENGKMHFCGCYFSAALWEEYITRGKTRWKCMLCWDKVKDAFPEEYAEAKSLNPDLELSKSGTCGLTYRPYKDGPTLLLELLVDDEWIAIVSERLPQQILDLFQQAQGEWYRVLHSDSAKDIKMKILKHATRPSIQNLVQNCPLKCVGKFPLKEFYEEGNKPLTGVDWVKFFIEVSEKRTDDMPGLHKLSKVCHKFLKSTFGDAEKSGA